MNSKQILDRLIREFPGLINGEDEINGGDLVDLLCRLLPATEEESK